MSSLPILLQDGDYVLKVKAGDKVQAGDILALKKAKQKEEVIHLFKNYSINLQKDKKSLKKNLGDFIEENEILAIKSSFLGGKKVLSPFSGTIIKIDEERGDVFVRTASEEVAEKVISPVDGEVDFCNNEKIVIKSSGDAIHAELATGEDSEGETQVVDNEDKLTETLKDKIILVRNGGRLLTFKAIGVGAKGLIFADADQDIFEELLEKRIKIPVLRVGEENFEKLQKKAGEKVILKPQEKSITRV